MHALFIALTQRGTTMDEQQQLIERLVQRIREMLEADEQTGPAIGRIGSAWLEAFASELLAKGQISVVNGNLAIGQDIKQYIIQVVLEQIRADS
jgi:hypothetical protein